MNDQLTKLAKLAHRGASIKSMAAVFNLEESQILQLVETPDYRAELSTISIEEFDKSNIVDQGWDAVEEMSISNVIDNLRMNPDPDFALKAAALANKAIRRNGSAGNKQNTPIQVNTNLQAVIQIQPAFAKTLQDNYLIEDVKEEKLPKKIVNALNPTKVKQLLSNVTGLATEVNNDMLADFLVN